MLTLISYKDSSVNTASKLMSLATGTKEGLKRSASEPTRDFAKTQDKNPPPENTRSNPADRIKRFREKIEKDTDGFSDFYKKSAKLFIQCVLSAVYGEKISIESYTKTDIIKTKNFPGQEFFIDSVLAALGTETIITLRKRDGKLIGLFSKEGPIPVVENPLYIPELEIDESLDLASTIKNLCSQDKETLMFYLLNNENFSCGLFADIRKTLEETEKVKVQKETGAYHDAFKVEELAKLSIVSFPSFIGCGDAILADKIAVVPIQSDTQPFGYYYGGDSEKKPLYIKVDGIDYAALPPLTQEAVDASKEPGFCIESVEFPNDDNIKKYVIENNKLVSITVIVTLKNKNLRQIVRRTYSNEEICFIKCFPAITIYGPVPLRGWIARRDIPNAVYSSPLESDAAYDLKDIKFYGIEEKFEDTGENWTVYRGEIPLWLGIQTGSKDWLGALPLRVTKEEGKIDYLNKPNFIHTDIPSGRMIAAADIGSSRSAILFHKIGENEEKDIIIADGQPLGFTMAPSDRVKDSEFGIMFFEPESQKGVVAGKTPMGLLTTNKYQNNSKDDVMLFESGKLILLDAKSISDASSRKILSDIKAGVNQKAMYLLAQGMLTMIIDRAAHLECSKIELRLSYLIERYDAFQNSWKSAIKKFKELFPQIDVQINLCLPESLAIANYLKASKEFTPVSGAAIVDIGDFTTDFALFKKEIGGVVKLEDTVSIQFAGRQIVIQPIWDYLKFSNAKPESLFEIKSEEAKKAVQRLEESRKNQKKEIGKLPEDVRRDILCLMKDLKAKDEIPLALQNLFDICYLTEMLLLKCLLTDFGKDQTGDFDVYLFGGGSYQFNFNADAWGKVVQRQCDPKNRAAEGNVLASGLLKEIDKDLKDVAADMKKRAENFQPEKEQKDNKDAIPSKEDLEIAYIRFLKYAQLLKPWKVLDKNDNVVSTGELFNVKKPYKDQDGLIDDASLYSSFWNESIDYAVSSCGSLPESKKRIKREIIETLFAYKVAYSSAVSFYSKE